MKEKGFKKVDVELVVKKINKDPRTTQCAITFSLDSRNLFSLKEFTTTSRI